jgi:tRNA dimethylallyltransferase
MDIQSKIILVAGPTASGKSSFAVKLAKKINGEVINSDSMQVYKELKVLTARPDKNIEKKIIHHLYGFQNINKKFSTGRWLKLVKKKIKEVKTKNKIPILVGGTGLYFKSLTEGLVEIPNIPIKIRNQTRYLQRNIGQKNFYSKLLKLDPLVKNQINPNDSQRSIRAFEIKKFTKKSITRWIHGTKSLFDTASFIKIYIDFPREDLLIQIKKRINKMFKNGAINEVKKFNRFNIKKENTVNKVIGIEEIRKYLIGDSNIDETKEKIYIKTRQYAKRQSTWARGQMRSWQKVHPKDLTSLLKKFK